MNGTIDIGAYEYMPAMEMKSVDNASSLTIFPNPVSSELQLSINSQHAGTVTIVNASGQILFSENVEQGTKLFEISMENYLPGFYLVSYLSIDGTIYRKLIKE
jgi:hypothetical protein